jgi:hypothetical protein
MSKIAKMRKEFKPRKERISLSERLESKIDRSGGIDSCHPWTGASKTGTHPYGLIRVRQAEERSRYKKAHRVVWELANGEIPSDLVVLHSCDNPRCCNIRHLSIGTQADNLKDMFQKGRNSPPPIGLRGTKNKK